MAAEDESPKETAEPAPAPKSPRRAAKASPAPDAAAKEPTKAKAPEGPKAPRRPALDAGTQRLLGVRRRAGRRRARFTRQASYRYERIGRWGAWRKPRGLQSKQRRHYKYRSAIVRIGYRGPAAVRGLTPSGFRPVLVRTAKEIEGLAPATQAAVIARSVGTRRRLSLEETARKLGIHVLNPIVREEEEESS